MSRQRYRHDPVTRTMVPVDTDYQGEHEATGIRRSEEEIYGNVGVTDDGTLINTRRRHREYMQSKGYTMASDYKDSWAKAADWREKYQRGEIRDPNIRNQLGRTLYELGKKK